MTAIRGDTMTNEPLSAETIKNFLYASTATVSMQMLKRGFRNTSISGVRPLNPKATRLVGPVYPGDVIVADEDGAICVPRHLADEVARDSFEQERLEKFVAIRVAKGIPIPGTYPPNDETKKLYQAWIKAGEPSNG